MNKESAELNKEKVEIEQKIKAIEVDVGPAVYVAQALYGSKDASSIESAIRVIIFMIVFAFDPLAIVLIVSAKKPEEVIPEPKPVVVLPVKQKRRVVRKPKVVA